MISEQIKEFLKEHCRVSNDNKGNSHFMPTKKLLRAFETRMGIHLGESKFSQIVESITGAKRARITPIGQTQRARGFYSIYLKPTISKEEVEDPEDSEDSEISESFENSETCEMLDLLESPNREENDVLSTSSIELDRDEDLGSRVEMPPPSPVLLHKSSIGRCDELEDIEFLPEKRLACITDVFSYILSITRSYAKGLVTTILESGKNDLLCTKINEKYMCDGPTLIQILDLCRLCDIPIQIKNDIVRFLHRDGEILPLLRKMARLDSACPKLENLRLCWPPPIHSKMDFTPSELSILEKRSQNSYHQNVYLQQDETVSHSAQMNQYTTKKCLPKMYEKSSNYYSPASLSSARQTKKEFFRQPNSSSSWEIQHDSFTTDDDVTYSYEIFRYKSSSNQSNQFRATPVIYNGTRFRSQLETKFCILLDMLNVEYNYEKLNFTLSNNKSTYRPDFWLKRQKIVVEIKPEFPHVDEIEKCEYVSREFQLSVVILYGEPACFPMSGFDGKKRLYRHKMGMRGIMWVNGERIAGDAMWVRGPHPEIRYDFDIIDDSQIQLGIINSSQDTRWMDEDILSAISNLPEKLSSSSSSKPNKRRRTQ